ncbi:MAG: TatD family hydrolase [Planctomycetaceae bacterium]|nr:TatD family hydrolase [Planctomycetaceae bacterium]
MSDLPPLIDTHCHLCHERLAERIDDVLAAARSAGVVAVIVAAGDLAEAAAARDLARSHRDLSFIAGIHPHAAKSAAPGYLDTLRAMAAEPRFAAVGEIGLDYHYDFSPREIQRRVFAEQLDAARQLGAGAIIHTREAFDDTLAIVGESGLEGGHIVFHSFTEDPAAARRALDLGAMISFSGIVTFAKSQALRQTAAIVPDDRLLIETDAPYLSPEPVRKMKTNEPANVAHVARCLAAVRGVSYDAIARQTTANARRFLDRT